MAVTSREVAQLAGVSRSTVSYILGGRGDRFSAATRESVLEAARKLGYSPQPAGRALRSGRSDVVVVELPHVLNGIFVDRLVEYGRAFEQYGLTALFQSGEVTQASIVGLVSALRPRAYIATRSIPDDQARLLSEAGIRPISMSTSAFDQAILSAQLTVLADRGCTQVRYVRLLEAERDVFQMERQAAFVRTAGARGWDHDAITVSLHSEDGAQELAGLAAGTGLACYNDEAAGLVLRHLADAGRSVPGEIAVVGVDDAPLASLVTPRLTTVAPEIDFSWDALMERYLDGNGAEPAMVEIQPTNVVIYRRESA